MNAVAERYAHLVLALGQHDPDYVDAFYGPSEWKEASREGEKAARSNRIRCRQTANDPGEEAADSLSSTNDMDRLPERLSPRNNSPHLKHAFAF